MLVLCCEKEDSFLTPLVWAQALPCALDSSSENPAFLESLVGGRMLESAPKGESIVPLENFNSHMGSNSVTLKGVIGRNSLFYIYLSCVPLLNFCASHSLPITNTMFNQSCSSVSISAHGTRTLWTTVQ